MPAQAVGDKSVTMSRRYWLLGLLAIAVAVAGIWVFHSKPAVSVTTASVTSGPIARPIVATGTLQAVTTVQVGSQDFRPRRGNRRRLQHARPQRGSRRAPRSVHV